MMSNIEEFQYGVCCCCLEKGDHRDFTKQYCLYNQPEVDYETLFKSTFELEVKYPRRNTKLICNNCIVDLKKANRFRSAVQSSQQSLYYCEDWQPECDDVKEEPLEMEWNTESIQSDADNQMEEVDNDMLQAESIIVVLNSDGELIEIKNENSVEEEEASQQINTDSNSLEPNDDMEGESVADHPNMQEISDPSTSSSEKLPVTQHVMIKNKRRFVCDFCPYKTAHKLNLKMHLRTHRTNKPFSCGLCRYKTAREGELMAHLRTHTDEKTFSCNICKYKTTFKGNLKMHLRTHTTEKLYSIDKSLYKTDTEGELKVHSYTRTYERKHLRMKSASTDQKEKEISPNTNK